MHFRVLSRSPAVNTSVHFHLTFIQAGRSHEISLSLVTKESGSICLMMLLKLTDNNDSNMPSKLLCLDPVALLNEFTFFRAVTFLMWILIMEVRDCCGSVGGMRSDTPAVNCPAMPLNPNEPLYSYLCFKAASSCWRYMINRNYYPF